MKKKYELIGTSKVDGGTPIGGGPWQFCEYEIGRPSTLRGFRRCMTRWLNKNPYLAEQYRHGNITVTLDGHNLSHYISLEEAWEEITGERVIFVDWGE